MKTILLVLLLTVALPTVANELCQIVKDAVVIAQDSKNTYLGKITNGFDNESIFNEFGTYGGKFSGDSIWNEFSSFGSEFSAYSPFNEFTSTPPMIIKNNEIIGYLSINKFIPAAVSPNLLKALCGG